MDLERQALLCYVRAFAWLLLAAALLPFDFYGSEPLWPWQGMMDAGPCAAGAFACFALTLASLLLWKWAQSSDIEHACMAPIVTTIGAVVVATAWLWHWFGPMVEMLSHGP